jgi:hypothetical protein
LLLEHEATMTAMAMTAAVEMRRRFPLVCDTDPPGVR